MNKKSRPLIPINLISGPLGVGKTTTINHLLSLRPAHEKWAVLVNEYGLVGLDAALMAPDSAKGHPGVEIREVAGGCICCSAGVMFDMSLVLLLQRRPDRLLIEPTGLAALSGILDTMDRPGIREAVDIQSVICILDPRRLREDLEREEVADQIEAADILLASRPDLASPKQLEMFDGWARALFPPKRFVGQVEQGRVDLALLELVKGRTEAAPRAGHKHGTDHHEHSHEHSHEHHDDADGAGSAEEVKEDLTCDASRPFIERSHLSTTASTVGWICWHDLVFDAKRIYRWLHELSEMPASRRVKAVFRTNEGWWSFNFAHSAQEVCPSSYRRDSRLEVIFEGAQCPDPETLGQSLRACVRTPEDDEDQP